MIAKFIAAAAATCLIAGQAQAADVAAAQLSAIKGQVMINHGGKFVPATAGGLTVGDRIVAMTGGQARLKYADGCVATLTPQAMATISTASPCASGVGLVNAAGGASAQASPKGMTALQWGGVGLTTVVLGVGIAAAADNLSVSN